MTHGNTCTGEYDGGFFKREEAVQLFTGSLWMDYELMGPWAQTSKRLHLLIPQQPPTLLVVALHVFHGILQVNVNSKVCWCCFLSVLGIKRGCLQIQMHPH